MITTDTSNGARLLSKLLAEEIDFTVKATKEELGDAVEDEDAFLIVIIQDCHMDICGIFSSTALQRRCPHIC